MINIVFSSIAREHPFCPLGMQRAGLPRATGHRGLQGQGQSVFKETQGCIRDSANELPPKKNIFLTLTTTTKLPNRLIFHGTQVKMKMLGGLE